MRIPATDSIEPLPAIARLETAIANCRALTAEAQKGGASVVYSPGSFGRFLDLIDAALTEAALCAGRNPINP